MRFGTCMLSLCVIEAGCGRSSVPRSISPPPPVSREAAATIASNFCIGRCSDFGVFDYHGEMVVSGKTLEKNKPIAAQLGAQLARSGWKLQYYPIDYFDGYGFWLGFTEDTKRPNQPPLGTTRGFAGRGR